MPSSARPSGYVTSVALIAIGGVHVAWGLGSSFPFASRDELADAAIGTTIVPPPAACGAVAGALFVAAALTADVGVAPPALRRLGRGTITCIFAARGVLGLLGRTDVVSPGSTSERFRSLDRRFFAPLCLLLAAGSATAVTHRRAVSGSH